jgi:hypothetical protein
MTLSGLNGERALTEILWFGIMNMTKRALEVAI